MKEMKVLDKSSCCPSHKPAKAQSIFAPRPFSPPVEEHEAPAAGPGIGFNFADISLLPRETVQPKLVPGPVGDKYEQEADRVARRVVESVSSSDQGAVQRQEDLEDEDELDFEEALKEEEELVQGKFASGLIGSLQAKVEAPPNKTGMPDRLKSGLESLSGMDLSGVRVHYNSPKPAHLNALAYTQGQDIHVAPKQEKHLPHEGWHAVQQMQGRVKPTMQAKWMSINDDAALEREADVMGRKAVQQYARVEKSKVNKSRAAANSVVQKKSNVKQGFGFVDNRYEAIEQRKIQLMANNIRMEVARAPGGDGINSCLQRVTKNPVLKPSGGKAVQVDLDLDVGDTTATGGSPTVFPPGWQEIRDLGLTTGRNNWTKWVRFHLLNEDQGGPDHVDNLPVTTQRSNHDCSWLNLELELDKAAKNPAARPLKYYAFVKYPPSNIVYWTKTSGRTKRTITTDSQNYPNFIYGKLTVAGTEKAHAMLSDTEGAISPEDLRKVPYAIAKDSTGNIISGNKG